MMLERHFQRKLISRLELTFPRSRIFKIDVTNLDSHPDLFIVNGARWATLEVKRSSDAPKRPNQEYYVDLYSSMSYASFVYPENLEEVLDELQEEFTP